MAQEPKNYTAVVIGSGFGGTISALTLANYFHTRNAERPRDSWEYVCVLERGQWWVSNETPFVPENIRTRPPNLREYLQDEGQPFGYWAHPDGIEGLFQLASMSKQISRTGLYDYGVISDSVQSITASGVGGGSLVYSNVTLRPPQSIYRSWPTEKEGRGLTEYFEPAEKFLGLNRITTVTGLSNDTLLRSTVFQSAARAAKLKHGHIINTDEEGFDAELSITDVPGGLFGDLTKEEIDHYKDNLFESNICERAGRCNLGCLPSSRHTFDKKLARAMMDGKPLEVRALTEAYQIEYSPQSEYPYTIRYKQTEPKSDAIVKATMSSKILIVAAGTLGTIELLLKSSAKGLHLSKKLGEGFSTDGDLLGLMNLSSKRAEELALDNTLGPVITSVAKFRTEEKEFAFVIEDTAIAAMLANVFATIFELLPGTRRRLTLHQKMHLIRRYPLLGLGVLFSGLSIPMIQRILTRAWNDKNLRQSLWQIAKGATVQNAKSLEFANLMYNFLFLDDEKPYASPAERLSQFLVFSCMGTDNADGTVSLRPDWETMEETNDIGEKLLADWSPEKNRRAFDEITAGLKELAEEIEPGGASRVLTPTWNPRTPSQSSVFLLHPLGCCRMGENIESGVVNSYGQVFMPDDGNKKQVYPGFYIIDGSVIPSSLGVNSSLAIAAVALRAIENVVGDKRYWPS